MRMARSQARLEIRGIFSQSGLTLPASAVGSARTLRGVTHMRIDPSLNRNFPKLAEWITIEIPKCRYDARIWPAFLKYSQLSTSAAASALSYNGFPPTIDISVQRSYGSYRPRFKRNRDKIFISRNLCREFEKQDPDYRVSKPYDLIMTATILHEMVHWGDFIFDYINQPDKDIYDSVKGKWLKGMDVGFQFENEAFYGIYTREYL
ncbi:MAG TPA: hypothetical protein DCS31_06865 [Candidatus Competibacteraceae bacterium]|nr:hypothetical protein [Candidatus Competibacteraceae bacterium]